MNKFKVGNILRCVNITNLGNKVLTIGNYYTILKIAENENFVLVMCDHEAVNYCHAERFIYDIPMNREKTIDDILK